MAEKIKVLFVCKYNSCRTQMAEAFLKKYGADRFEAESAGLETGDLNPYAIAVMESKGLDISHNKSKTVFELFKEGRYYDYVISVCSYDDSECPVFPGRTIRKNWNLPDPASFDGTDDEILEKTALLCSDIEHLVLEFIATANPAGEIFAESTQRFRKMPRLKVLFLCTGNSCRSQMAEGWARFLKNNQIEAYSAGIRAQGLNPNAVKVMAEAGVDISRQTSKTLDALSGITFDYVVTVCGHAHGSCPVFPGGVRVLHVPFDDPPHLAADAKTEEEALSHYRRVRDKIKEFVLKMPENLTER